MATEDEQTPAAPSAPVEPDWVTAWNAAVDDWDDACRGRL